MSTFTSRRQPRGPAAVAFVAILASAVAFAQTPIKAPKNKYTPEQDVQLGQEAAAEVRQQYPVIDDRRIDAYLDELGQRLVEASPREFDNPAFQYSFTPVNLKDINAFALPGGPMFINRGMFDAAHSEGEVVGVMAHELSHVLLRHGTANATKAQGFQIGAIAGAIAGAVIGGGVGELISQGSQFGLGTWMLKYSRDYEKQADLLGAQIMARAGYDPRDLGRMFETINEESRSKGGTPPQWLSSHPDPGNRSQYIAKEAQALRVAATQSDPGEFRAVKQRFSGLPPAKSMAELEKRGGGGGGNAPASVGTVGNPVPAPSGQYRTAQGGKLFQVSVPSNWTPVATNNSVKYVPQNGYGDYQGQSVFTHGVELGVARAASRDLRESTEALVQAFARGNPDMRMAGQQRVVRLSGRDAIATPLAGRSALGSERIGLYTTLLSDGNLFYYLTVVPEDEADRYGQAFDRIGQSIRLNDR